MTTKAEKQHRKAVAELGCIVCRNQGNEGSPAELHHIRAGAGMGRRSSEFEVIPLCPFHHRHGGWGHAIHAGRIMWEANHGTERDLLTQVLLTLGKITCD